MYIWKVSFQYTNHTAWGFFTQEVQEEIFADFLDGGYGNCRYPEKCGQMGIDWRKVECVFSEVVEETNQIGFL